MDGSGTRHRSPDASRLGIRSRCLACSTERLHRRIYLLRRANLTMTGVRAGPSQRAIRLIASSSSPNRPLQVDDMSVPQTANYNVAVSSRLVGATLVGHVTLMGSTCPAACAARQRQGGPRGGPAHLPRDAGFRREPNSAKGGSDGDSACGEATGEISATKRERGPGGAFCANRDCQSLTRSGRRPSSTEYSL